MDEKNILMANVENICIELSEEFPLPQVIKNNNFIHLQWGTPNNWASVTILLDRYKYWYKKNGEFYMVESNGTWVPASFKDALKDVLGMNYLK